jgi:uncharacterized protein with PIN domain
LQLRDLVARFHLDLLTRAFTRCVVCNVPLEEGSGEAAPERVRTRCTTFLRCPSCGRTFWEGTHVERLRRRFEGALSAE